MLSCVVAILRQVRAKIIINGHGEDDDHGRHDVGQHMPEENLARGGAHGPCCQKIRILFNADDGTSRDSRAADASGNPQDEDDLQLALADQRHHRESQKESLSIPSIVRQTQAENMETFIDKIQNDEAFVKQWIKVTKDNINHSRKATKELLDLDEINDIVLPKTV